MNYSEVSGERRWSGRVHHRERGRHTHAQLARVGTRPHLESILRKLRWGTTDGKPSMAWLDVDDLTPEEAEALRELSE
jgi:hypothetical protein